MSNWSTLKAAVANVIKTNGNNEITGALLQSTLNSIISNLGENYQFVDIATTTTVPGTPDGNVFYIAIEKGTYPNFAGIVLGTGDGMAILAYNGTWSKKNIPIASAADINAKIFNATTFSPLETGHYTLTTAIAVVTNSSDVRKKGLELLFEVSANVWEIWQFKGNDSAGFTTLTNWELIFTSGRFGNLAVLDNLDTVSKSGNYTAYGAAVGAPNATYSWFVEHFNSSVGTVSAYQRAIGYTTDLVIYERTKIASVWGAWKQTGVTKAELEQVRSDLNQVASFTDSIYVNKGLKELYLPTLDFSRGLYFYIFRYYTDTSFPNGRLQIQIYYADDNTKALEIASTTQKNGILISGGNYVIVDLDNPIFLNPTPVIIHANINNKCTLIDYNPRIKQRIDDLARQTDIATVQTDVKKGYLNVGIATTSTIPATYKSTDRVEYDFFAPIGTTVLSNFNGLSITVKEQTRHKLRWNGTTWSAIVNTKDFSQYNVHVPITGVARLFIKELYLSKLPNGVASIKDILFRNAAYTNNSNKQFFLKVTSSDYFGINIADPNDTASIKTVLSFNEKTGTIWDAVEGYAIIDWDFLKTYFNGIAVNGEGGHLTEIASSLDYNPRIKQYKDIITLNETISSISGKLAIEYFSPFVDMQVQDGTSNLTPMLNKGIMIPNAGIYRLFPTASIQQNVTEIFDESPYQLKSNLKYNRYVWGSLEQQEGVYLFDEVIEPLLRDCITEKSRIILGLASMCGVSSSYSSLKNGRYLAVPEYVFDLVASTSYPFFEDNTYGSGYTANYESPIILEKFNNFLSAFSTWIESNVTGTTIKRKDLIYAIEQRYMGYWGEGSVAVAYYPTTSTVFDSYIQSYVDYFTDILVIAAGQETLHLPSSSSYSVSNPKHIVAINHVYKLFTYANSVGGFGIYIDSWNPFVAQYEDGSTLLISDGAGGTQSLPIFLNSNIWKKRYITGEGGYFYKSDNLKYQPYQFLYTQWKKRGISGISIHNFSNHILSGDIIVSTIGIEQNIKNCLSFIGYRIVLTSPKKETVDAGIKISFYLTNIGVSKLYHDYYEVHLITKDVQGIIVNDYTSTFDIRTILPSPSEPLLFSECFGYKFEDIIPSNTGNLFLKIIDKKGIEKPMCLSNYGRDENGEYLLLSLS